MRSAGLFAIEQMVRALYLGVLGREPDPEGDRVVVTLNGKFLPYQW